MEYVFIREDFFYIIDMPDGILALHGEQKVISDNAQCNPGTLKVETLSGKTVWQLPESQ